MRADWKEILRTNFTSLPPLLDYLELSPEERAHCFSPKNFIINLPRRLAGKIKKGTLDDALLRQFVPLIDEMAEVPGFVSDPVGEFALQQKNFIQKYAKRALLVSTSACAMHCRYCFRRSFPYSGQLPTAAQLEEDLQARPDLDEIILSGGDPLSLSDSKLAALLAVIEKQDHIRRIRWHTRFLIGIPERITDKFCALLAASNKQHIFVIHCNHASELDAEVAQAICRLKSLGPVLVQTVFLRGVNDTFEALSNLFSALVNLGAMPYYLHKLDPVTGAAHFAASDELALNLLAQCRKVLPGYAIPTFVQEIAGEPSKTPLGTASCK